MQHFKIMLWAAMHSDKFSQIHINSPIQVETPYRYSQCLRISVIFLYALDAIIFIPWDLQRDYHNHIVKQGLNLDFFAFEQDYDDVPF